MQVYFKAIRFVLCGMLLGSLVVTTAWFVPQAGAQEIVPDSDDDVTVRYVSPSEARESDIAQRARDTGQTVEQVRQIRLFEDAFVAYASALFSQYEDQITSVWVQQEPTTKGYVRFVQEVPPDAIAALATFEMLDADNVILLDDGTMSLEDHYRRVPLAADAMVDLGYQNVIVSFDHIEDNLDITLLLPKDTPPPNVDELVPAVQQQLDNKQRVEVQDSLQGAAAIVDTDDLDLVILRGSGPILKLDSVYARGGERVSGAGNCTSGWSVSGSQGDGIITAGHCTLDEFWFPGGTTFALKHVYSVRDSRGDAGYYRTEQIPSEAEFYDGFQVRDVTNIMPTSAMGNIKVCVYGRSSNDRRCNYEVVSTYASMRQTGGIIVNNLARLTNPDRVLGGGDSGGPVYLDTVAWGMHIGRSPTDEFAFFMPVERAQNELNVVVKTR